MGARRETPSGRRVISTAMTCSDADALVQAYVDNELAGVDRDGYEQHLLACEGCAHTVRLQARFKAAVRGHLSRQSVPLSLRTRIESALDVTPAIPRRWPWHVYPRLMPATAAAVLLLVIGISVRGRQSTIFEQALRTYHAQMPMDVVASDCGSIASWFRGKLDFTVQPPAARGADCQGGRLVNLTDRLAAYVVYQSGDGHRVGMMVFPSDDDAIEMAQHRLVGGMDVYVRSARGASAAAFRRPGGLSYVVTSDLDEEGLSNFIQAAFQAAPVIRTRN